MNDESSKLLELQQCLEEAEKNTITAAMYGKQLLEENHELRTKLDDTIKEYAATIEGLEQEKHCISRKLESNLQKEHSLTREIEQLCEQHNQQMQSLEAQRTRNHELELQKYAKKLSNLEATIESLHIENTEMKDQLVLSEAQLKETQERLDMYNTSIHEQSTDETTTAVQSQIMTLTCEKQELEKQVSSLTVQVKTNKNRLLNAEKNVAKLEESLEECECRSTSYFNDLEKSKIEIMELKMEMENLRFSETDPAKKGNSLFAEVEDHRQAMEKQLLSYKTNFNVQKKQLEFKTQQINKMKLQLASLLSMHCNKEDSKYINHLEESVASARTQLEKFTKRCQDLEAQQAVTAVSKVEVADDGQDMSRVFRHLYTESQKKVSDLDQEVSTARFEKVVLSDRVLQLQRKLRQTEAARNAISSEVIMLRVRLEEMAAKKGIETGPDLKEVKCIQEEIPGFEKYAAASENKQISIQEQSVSLKEKLGDPNTMEEVDKQVRNIDKALEGPDVKKVKCMKEEMPGSEESASKLERNQIMGQETMPIKQELVDSNAMQGLNKQGRNMSKAPEGPVSGNSIDIVERRTMGNEENELPSKKLKKNTKKSVHMTETVAVYECDGQVHKTQIKQDGMKMAERKQKVLKKKEAPLIKITSGGQQEECKQQ